MRQRGFSPLVLATLAAFACPAHAQTDGEVITKQYNDGSVYEGTFKDGLQDGIGSYRLPSGFEYEGEWAKGQITKFEDVQKLLDMYYEQRGWDSNGVPTAATLDKVGLTAVVA